MCLAGKPVIHGEELAVLTGKDTALMTDSALLQTTRIVLTLAEPLANQGITCTVTGCTPAWSLPLPSLAPASS